MPSFEAILLSSQNVCLLISLLLSRFFFLLPIEIFDSMCRLNHKPLSRNFTLNNYFAGNALQCSLRCNVNIIGCSLSKTMSAHRLASMRARAQHKIKVENSYLYQQQQQKQLTAKCSTKSMVVAVFFLI